MKHLNSIFIHCKESFGKFAVHVRKFFADTVSFFKAGSAKAAIALRRLFNHKKNAVKTTAREKFSWRQFWAVNRKKKLIVSGAVAVGSLLILTGVGFAASAIIKTIYDPAALFQQPTMEAEATPEPTPTPKPFEDFIDESAADNPGATDRYGELYQEADKSIMNNTINVLLIGVDYATERDNNPDEYVGKNFNSDVMMVLAINFDENKVDMISIPRDTYFRYDDFPYKLNYSMTLGGGIQDSGFKMVCQNAGWVMGGIPIDYYIGVTMPVVKELTDAVGGVDFYVDVPFKLMGRDYQVGYQHMDGQAVLDYCRARKNMEQSGDLNRINRQKRMLLAVFQKLQRSTQIYDVPKILTSMQGKVYTNLTFQQLAALAVFGRKLDSNNITMRSLSGRQAMLFGGYGYVVTDQSARAQIVKEVYDQDTPIRPDFQYEYIKVQWGVQQLQDFLGKIQNAMNSNAAAKLTPEQLTALNAATAEATQVMNNGKSMMKNHKTSQWATVDAAPAKLQDTVTPILKTVGLSVNWRVDVYKNVKNGMRMKE